jgi:Cation efflux family
MAIEHNAAVSKALHLEIVTIVWMVIEALVAIAAGFVARSLLLVAFGIDSGIELTSAIVVLRCLRLKLKQGPDSNLPDTRHGERKASRIAGWLLLFLSAYVVVQAIFGLSTRHSAEASPLGIAVAVVAALGMPFLAKSKLRIADQIQSSALRADAMETITCGYLSWILLGGLAHSTQPPAGGGSIRPRRLALFLFYSVKDLKRCLASHPASVKKVSNEGLEPPCSEARAQRSAGQIWRSVKKGPTGHFQGAVPGEIARREFPFRLWKSLK